MLRRWNMLGQLTFQFNPILFGLHLSAALQSGLSHYFDWNDLGADELEGRAWQSVTAMNVSISSWVRVSRLWPETELKVVPGLIFRLPDNHIHIFVEVVSALYKYISSANVRFRLSSRSIGNVWQLQRDSICFVGRSSTVLLEDCVSVQLGSFWPLFDPLDLLFVRSGYQVTMPNVAVLSPLDWKDVGLFFSTICLSSGKRVCLSDSDLFSGVLLLLICCFALFVG